MENPFNYYMEKEEGTGLLGENTTTRSLQEEFQFRNFLAMKFTTRLLIDILLCGKLHCQKVFRLKLLLQIPGGGGLAEEALLLLHVVAPLDHVQIGRAHV